MYNIHCILLICSLNNVQTESKHTQFGLSNDLESMNHIKFSIEKGDRILKWLIGFSFIFQFSLLF